MRKELLFIQVAALLLLAGCALYPTQMHYAKSTLNALSLGNTKSQVLAYYKYDIKDSIPGMEIRASQKNSYGNLIEVGEVSLTDGITPTVSYWFIFENGLLVQWGRPEDWKLVATRYGITYNQSSNTR